MYINSTTKKVLRKVLGLSQGDGISLESLVLSLRLKIGKHFFKKKYSASDVIEAMKDAGMKKGSVVFIQSRWAEFYNCESSPLELIQGILDAIGPDGTLAMACMPQIREGKIFNVKRTSTSAGLLAEVFRKYPSVKRSINVRHSVCAIGKYADFLVSEHHLGDTPWDKFSPYYKLSEVDAILFGLGLGRYWIGTIIHCVDSLLKDELPYFSDMFYNTKTEYKYIDYDGSEKSYWNYDMSKPRIDSYILNNHIAKKYLDSNYHQVSNLQISCFQAKQVVPKLVELGRKGIICYWTPSKKGYKFDK